MIVRKFFTICIIVGSVCFGNYSHASEQKIVFTGESIKYAKDTGSEKCQSACAYKNSKPDLQSLLNEGWKVVSSSPKEIIARDYEVWSASPTSRVLSWGCTCIGTQYVIQKDDPAPPPKVESSNKEAELLKKENELLKQEIRILKQENENLKSKPKSKKK